MMWIALGLIVCVVIGWMLGYCTGRRSGRDQIMRYLCRPYDQEAS
jgi:hypothetical protein